MELKRYNVYFFFLMLVGISVMTYFIFRPFLLSILLAAILAVIFQRPYNSIVQITGNRKKVSAFLVAFFGMIIFSGLFLLIVGLILNEVSSFYQSSIVGQDYQKYLNNLLNYINSNGFLRSVGLANLINVDTVKSSISQIGQNAFVILQKTYQGIANLVFFTVVMFFTLYYFLISGKDIIKNVMYLSPLRNSHEKILIEKFISMSRATINGNLIVGIVQGSIGAILFSAVGIHSAVIWGIAMMFFSLLPMFGTAFVWLPVGITMLILGNTWQGIVILAIGVSIISLIDNFLSPKLIGKDTQMHPLLVFFATLGGISLFGFLGFILGPIIVALFLSLWEIYGVEFKTQLKNYNS